jgi:hypothetical protein
MKDTDDKAIQEAGRRLRETDLCPDAGQHRPEERCKPARPRGGHGE